MQEYEQSQKIEAPVGEGGGTFDAEGYLDVNGAARRMEWGSQRFGVRLNRGTGAC